MLIFPAGLPDYYSLSLRGYEVNTFALLSVAWFAGHVFFSFILPFASFFSSYFVYLFSLELFCWNEFHAEYSVLRGSINPLVWSSDSCAKRSATFFFLLLRYLFFFHFFSAFDRVKSTGIHAWLAFISTCELFDTFKNMLLFRKKVTRFA